MSFKLEYQMFWLLEFGFWCYKNGFNTSNPYLYGILTLWVLTIDYRQTTMFWYVRDVSELIGWVPDFWQTDWACYVFVFLIMTFRVESYCFENMKKKNPERGDIRTKNSKLSVEKLFSVYFWRIRAVFGKIVLGLFPKNLRGFWRNCFKFIPDGFARFLEKRCCLNKMCRAECVCSTNKGFKDH